MNERRRRADRSWHRLIRENAYRDVWLLAISIIVVLAVAKSIGTASQAKGLARAVQRQRLDNIRSNCEQSNQRHDRTIVTLNRLIGHLPSRQRLQAHQNEKFTVELISALAPKRDCAALVRAARLPH